MKVVKHRHRLPREVVDAPSLETFKARLDGALSNLLQLKMSLLVAGGLHWMTFNGPFQPKQFYDSVIQHWLKCPARLGALHRENVQSLPGPCPQQPDPALESSP